MGGYPTRYLALIIVVFSNRICMNVVELNEWVVLVPTRAGGLCGGLKRAEGGRFGRWKPNAVGSLAWARLAICSSSPHWLFL